MQIPNKTISFSSFLLLCCTILSRFKREADNSFPKKTSVQQPGKVISKLVWTELNRYQVLVGSFEKFKLLNFGVGVVRSFDS